MTVQEMADKLRKRLDERSSWVIQLTDYEVRYILAKLEAAVSITEHESAIKEH